MKLSTLLGSNRSNATGKELKAREYGLRGNAILSLLITMHTMIAELLLESPFLLTESAEVNFQFQSHPERQ
jgi:hypothetical protein